MLKTMDEHDVQWEVKTKDPAMDIVRKLNKANFTYIVLPRSTYRTGQVDESMVQLKPYAISEVRMNDCLRYLCR